MKRESRGRNLSIRTPWEVDVPGLRIGLIGLGRHGMRYAQHMRELAPRATLVAVCRRDALQGAAFADTHGLRFHNDFRALIADPHVDAVVVVTPPSLTSVICGEAIRANKPLLIEKPLAMSGAVARTMAEAAESARVPLMTAQTLRFDSTIQALEQYLRPDQIELSFEEGMLFRRLELFLAGQSPAVALFSGDSR